MCATSVVIAGEIATCIAAHGHKGKHELRWEGDPRKIAHDVAHGYREGLLEMRATLVRLLEQVDETLRAIDEACP